ncbi:hypothetical protein RHSIM_Rhsim07G0052100 [Rhododendron simsii]|uniref:DUF4283 domain-containing protein n=1 Tax=Rhododendron simsii TaxID=118357 RepID=A0A834GRE2_RHOSS|nr:hypothetical protein RHSIM_Rhsim07G0052100 [Rhododendron simsii]
MLFNFQAVQSTNGNWIWGKELVVNLAKFLKKQDRYPDRSYSNYNQENPKDGEVVKNQGRYKNQRPNQFYNRYNQETLEDGGVFRNQGRVNNQHPNFSPLANGSNSTANGKQLAVYQKKSRIQFNNPHLKKAEERGKEVWRRKGVPESSKQGANTGMANQANEGKDEGKILNVQAVGNGWLNRSAVGKMRRIISAQDLEAVFKKGKAGSVQIKPMGGRYVIISFLSIDQRDEILKEEWLELWFEEVKPWNGDSAKDERFVWLACYGMPLNAWNVPTFRAIGSRWGCFIEVDSNTLEESIIR